MAFAALDMKVSCLVAGMIVGDWCEHAAAGAIACATDLSDPHIIPAPPIYRSLNWTVAANLFIQQSRGGSAALNRRRHAGHRKGMMAASSCEAFNGRRMQCGLVELATGPW